MEDLLPLLGVVLGGVLGLGGNVLSEYFRRRAEARSVAYAFLGEVSGLVEIISRRGYIGFINQAADRTEETGVPFVIDVPVKREYFSVYKACVAKLGLLEAPLPQRIANMYTLANSCLEDLERFRDESFGSWPPERVVATYRELSEIMTQTVSIGEQIIEAIEIKYPAGTRGTRSS